MSSTPQKNISTNGRNSSYCSKCDNLGVILLDDGKSQRCDCGIMDRVIVSHHIKNARIPKRFASRSLESFKADDHIRKTLLSQARSYGRTFTGEEDRGLILRGGTGAGKTHLAIGILKEVLNRGYSGIYYNITDLLSGLRDTYSKNSDIREAEILNEIDSVDFIVFDDLGAEAASEWMRDRLYLILNRRYENAKATVITTNCTESELREQVGNRIASRLYEMCDPFGQFPKEDYRFTNMR